jgi:hypothetical protein
MFSVAIKSILASVILSVTLTAFPYDISCKDEKGKQVFTLNYEKPLSTQISNKLGMKTAVLKGLNDSGERYSFIANSILEENSDENQNLILNGFGQITKKPLAGKQSISSLKSITFRMNKHENILNLGTIEFISIPFLQLEEQKIEYLNCHFDSVSPKEIKIYSRLLDAFKVKR